MYNKSSFTQGFSSHLYHEPMLANITSLNLVVLCSFYGCLTILVNMGTLNTCWDSNPPPEETAHGWNTCIPIHCHNNLRWNKALVTVGFPAVKHRCCAEGAHAHAEAGTGPHTDRVRNALSRPRGSVCFSYHHTHWKRFRRKIAFLMLTGHQRITLNRLTMHAHEVKADSR